MPTAAPKPCCVCRALVRDGTARCDAHKVRAGWVQRGREAGSRHERGYGYQWVKVVKRVRDRDADLCQPCIRRGDGPVGTYAAVDHIVPRSRGGTDDEANLQVICFTCHQAKTQMESAEAGAKGVFWPDWIPEPRVPVTVVCGPPGSGKSTLVRQRAHPRDLVLDLDELVAEVSGHPLYVSDPVALTAAVRLRNIRLAALAKDPPQWPRAWLIVGAPTAEERDWWVRKLFADLVTMPTSIAECEERVQADARRPIDVKHRQLAVLRRWEGGVKSWGGSAAGRRGRTTCLPPGNSEGGYLGAVVRGAA